MARTGPIAVYGANVGEGNSHFDIHVSGVQNPDQEEDLITALTTASYRLTGRGKPAKDEFVVEASCPLGQTLDTDADLAKIEEVIKSAGFQLAA